LVMPWEKDHGYSQAVKVGDTICLAGQSLDAIHARADRNSGNLLREHTHLHEQKRNLALLSASSGSDSMKRERNTLKNQKGPVR
jgi:hypothetical protein